MCSTIAQLPITFESLSIIESAYLHLPKQLFDGIYHAYSDNLTLPAIGLIYFLDLADRFREGRYSYLDEKIVRFPLCVLDTLQRVRYKDARLNTLHDVITTFHMSMKNVLLMREAFRGSGMEYVSHCSCGGDVASLGSNLLNHSLIQSMNKRNSTADTEAWEIIPVTDLESVLRKPGVDFLPVELNALEHIFTVHQSSSAVSV